MDPSGSFLCEKKMSKKLLALSLCAYVGTKSVLATTMTRGEYNEYRGWKIPENEDPEEQGYLVEYVDGGKPCDERHKGYISWSPKCVFKDAYRQNGNLTFGDAIHALRQGERVARSGWNGKDMWLIHINGEAVAQAIADRYGDGNAIPVLEAIYMKTATGELVPWLASQTDIFAEDWVIT